mmetsp:Transcript_15406/g.22888  ORF Transcript_15406/g.22888 Transcript_15406/m.22888 type:complete len:235 (+) Transcript_15406:55-759(+)
MFHPYNFLCFFALNYIAILAFLKDFKSLDKRIVLQGQRNPLSKPKFEIVDERSAYNGWRTITHRDIRMPSGHIATFDIMKQNDPTVLVFSWCTKSLSTTLIHELSPGKMSLNCGVVAGICEQSKHDSPLEAAKFELEEEAHLNGGEWISLITDSEGNIGTLPTEKYSTSSSYAFLVLDPVPAIEPRTLDMEEYIEIERNVTASEVTRRIQCGEMNIASSFICLLALKHIESMNE